MPQEKISTRSHHNTADTIENILCSKLLRILQTSNVSDLYAVKLDL
jgi:hypothetical protein